MDGSGANTAAVNGLVAVELRQSRYPNNLVEQDHPAIKQSVRPLLGFTDFHAAAKIISGIETMHRINKGQLDVPEGQALPAADQFYSRAI